jgi:predicted dithiol-disulfide oxidoreductase (DUF899 family)
MGKKEKKKKKDPKKLEEKLAGIEKDLAKSRKKMLKIQAKLAHKEVEDYILKDRDNNDVKLSSLFGDKKDLVLIHNMGKKCKYCTMWADGFNGIYKHIEEKAAFVLVSPDAPEIQKEFANERGWKFNMYSGKDTNFIQDMGYYTEKDGYWPGASVFHKEDGKITRVSKTFFGPGDYFCSVWHFFGMLPAEEESKE